MNEKKGSTLQEPYEIRRRWMEEVIEAMNRSSRRTSAQGMRQEKTETTLHITPHVYADVTVHTEPCT